MHTQNLTAVNEHSTFVQNNYNLGKTRMIIYEIHLINEKVYSDIAELQGNYTA